MKYFLVIAVCLFAVVYAEKDAEATILKESPLTKAADGTLSYSYETSNGIKADEKIRQIQVGKESGSASEGSYSYKAADGTIITVTYKADDKGFVASGAHLPTPPPIPDYVVKMLADIASAGQKS